MSTVAPHKKRKKAGRDPAGKKGDIDLSAYSGTAEKHGPIETLKQLPFDVKDKSLSVGIDAEERCRSGSFYQIDHSVLLSSAYAEGLEVMDINRAREKYKWLSRYWWHAVHADADQYTAQADKAQHHGYFVRTLPGTKVDFPLQACLFIGKEGLAQNVHNIVIAEEGSELNIITGCAAAQAVHTGLHVGISEFYVKKNARITFTMIHNWSDQMVVRPRSAIIVKENGLFMSNFICMKPVKDLQMYPTAICAGENATVRFNTVILAKEGSTMDIGSRVFLRAKNSRAEIISRALTRGGDIIARGHLIGEVPGVKAHLECRGLMLSDRGTIHAIPELEGRADNIDMSHEAAVGKIAEEEIHYLMARGLSSDEATAAIVRGFLDIEIKGLPLHLAKEVKKAVTMEQDLHLF
jgi:Fe-S cluster assembly scaffold protein SufB